MQNTRTALAATILRLSLGWFMLYAGLEKVFDPTWTSKSFLLGAKTFPSFYAWFASPANIHMTDLVNEWSITLVGVALLLGVGVRLASLGGIVLMLLYYFPQYNLPFVPHGFLIEEHLIYAAAFLMLATLPSSYTMGFGRTLRESFLGRIPLVRSLL